MHAAAAAFVLLASAAVTALVPPAAPLPRRRAYVSRTARPAKAKFCSACGVPMAVPGSAYCSACGAVQYSGPPPDADAPPAQPPDMAALLRAAVDELSARTAAAAAAPPPEPPAPAYETDPTTVREFFPVFWEARERDVGAHTQRVEKAFWREMLAAFGDLTLPELDAAHWETFARRLRGRKCSARTLALHQAAYAALLRYAAYLDLRPAPHPFRPIKGATKRTRDLVPFTAPEVTLLLDQASSQKYRALFALGVGNGLRPTELLGLDWGDVDWDRGTLRVRGSKTTASDNTVPMSALSVREMGPWWAEAGKPPAGLAFPADAGGKMGTFKTALKGAARRAGIDVDADGKPRRVFPYLLRHSFATLAATSSPPVPLPVAQAIMRHTSSKMLLETYAKAGALAIREGLELFPEIE